ncbi:type 1 glutamine amidotransferase domain-containing protein [Parapedobacter pyrenivorans]|uniref:Type 1 glutamine amidotransferase domain-containing protein n=1 Tax=Parapedobacter pyrenivorans TaxID=1305674 RepID=A0A917M668_9SPHI|nr:DJ-1/PfpI family protein [Parapedobacter pyrenivorans]GGG79866.1 type 1 glutamine amidotransferase domain-containing protein [Parapedobacter pyrenivorans]
MKIKNLIAAGVLLSNTVSAQNNKILFVMSAADTLELNHGEKLRQTGVFLNEFYLAYKSVTEAGYTVDFATPNGIVATIDEESINDKYWKNNMEVKTEALIFTKTDHLFNNPQTLEQAIERRSEYIGLIIPGGQGLMVDLKNDRHIPVLLTYFAKQNKPTGLICHAPSLILTIPKGENPYIGFNVNSVSPFEEFVIERFIMKGKPKDRKIAKNLRKLGLKYSSGLPKANYAVKDRNLVTSQNPFSGSAFNQRYLAALTEYLGNNNQ